MSRGHRYADVVEVYSFERTILFYLTCLRQQTEEAMQRVTGQVTGTAPFFAEKGGETLTKYTRSLEKQVAKLTARVQGILARNLEVAVGGNSPADALATLAKAAGDNANFKGKRGRPQRRR